MRARTGPKRVERGTTFLHVRIYNEARMRLFTGLDLGCDASENLRVLIERLRPAARIQWSPPEKLHVTTKFIGEWPEGRLEELKTALAALPGEPGIRGR